MTLKSNKGHVGPQIRELIQDVKFEDQLNEVERATWKSLKISVPIFWAITRQKYVFKGAFLRLSLRLLPRISEQLAMSTESDLSRTFPPWKSSAMASGVLVCQVIIDRHLEETFHSKIQHKVIHCSFSGNVYTLCNIEGVFKKRPNFLKSAPTSIESALWLLRAPSVRFGKQTAIFLIFVVPSIMLYSSEISPTRCNNCVFILLLLTCNEPAYL